MILEDNMLTFSDYIAAYLRMSGMKRSYYAPREYRFEIGLHAVRMQRMCVEDGELAYRDCRTLDRDLQAALEAMSLLTHSDGRSVMKALLQHVPREQLPVLSGEAGSPAHYLYGIAMNTFYPVLYDGTRPTTRLATQAFEKNPEYAKRFTREFCERWVAQSEAFQHHSPPST